MNTVNCSENCRWQNDGVCVLEDLSRAPARGSAQCRYFEEKT